MRKTLAILAVLMLCHCSAGLFGNNGPAGGSGKTTTDPRAVTTPHTPLYNAEIAYLDAADVYAAAMTGLQQLRAAHAITDAQWADIDKLQQQVRKYRPQVRALLDLWQATGTKPSNLDAATGEMMGGINALSQIAVQGGH